MFVLAESLDSLFDDVAKQITTSARQPREAIIRLAHRRIESGDQDIAAIHVIAAARIRNRQPDRCLRLLEHHGSALEHSAMGHRLAGYAYLMQHNIFLLSSLQR